jgi:hypothetical protein
MHAMISRVRQSFRFAAHQKERFMNPMNTRWPSLAFAATLLAAACPALAAPRFPTPPLPERAYVLHRESFDELYRSRMTNALLSVPGVGELRESWSGYALQRAGESLSPFVVAGTDAAGKPLIASASGAVRFWFRTYWASPSKDAPVSGPGAVARLVEMAAVASDGQALTCWSLDATPDGSALILSAQDDNGCREVLQARLNWRSGESHLVTLNYGPEASALYLDNQLAAEGKGVTPLPVEAAGMVVGSALDGRNPAQGEVEELFFLGRPLDAEQIGFYYGGTWKQAFLGPVGTHEEERAKQELLALEVELLAFESGSLMSLEEEDPGPPEDPLVYPDGSLYLEITGITNNLAHLIIHGTVPDTTYELLSKTDLTNAAWLSEGLVLGAVDQTNTPAEIDIGSRTNQLFIWARSWADGDGNGLPDCWELEYFGQTGQDGYDDPDGDGWVNIQEYQNGTHPTSFNSPPPPRNVVARLDSNGTNVTVTWESGGATADFYEIHNTAFLPVQTVDGNTFSITMPMESFATLLDARWQPKYWVRANFTNLVTATADSALAGIKRTDLAADVRIVRGHQGRWYLIVGSPPSDLDHILIEWEALGQIRTQLVVPATNLVNGIVEIPSEVVAINGEVYYQLFSATGASGDVGYAWGHFSIAQEQSGAYDSTLEYADVRPHMKENLKFLLRSATVTRPFSYAANQRTYWDPLWWEAFLGEITEPEEYYARPPSFAAYEYSGFRYFSSNLDYAVAGELRPLAENHLWRNFMVNASDLANTNIPIWLGDFYDNPLATRALDDPVYEYSGDGQETPLPVPLVNSAPSFLYYQWFSGSYYDFAAAADVGVVLNTVGTTNLMLQTGVRSCYGLQLLSLLNSEGEEAFPGDPLPGWWDTQYYANFETPVLETTNYYFASQTPYFRYNAPRPPLPGSPDFMVTNTSPIMIASFAQPMTIAGWAKQRIVNGYEGKFGYLEQLFDHAVCLGPNGQPTTNSAGTLSPYGEFFPTMPGPAALVTMPDLDTGQRGTGIVHVIKLQLDVNHDGAMDLSFAGPDNTSQARPLVWWANNDNDVSIPTGYHLGIDLDWPKHSDFETCRINSQRDLEDFARLWICGIPGLTNAGYQVTLHWANVTSGNPSIKLFNSVETNGGVGYLTVTNIASAQLNPANNSVISIGTVATGATFTFPANFFTNSATKYLLFEGAGIGSGELVMTIGQGTNVLVETSVFMDLHQVEDFYERGIATNVTSGLPPSNLTSQHQLLATTSELPDEAKQIIVHVHGINISESQWKVERDTIFKRLYWSGYHGRFASFRWPCAYLPFENTLWPYNYNKCEFYSWKSATALRDYLS